MLRALVLSILVLPLGLASVQTLPVPAPEAFAEPGATGRSAAALATAQRLIKEGRASEAAPHLQVVLTDHPYCPSLWREWLTVAPPELKGFLAHRWLGALSDPKARLNPDPATKRLLPSPVFEKLANQRMEAIAELIAYASKLKPTVPAAPGELLTLLLTRDLLQVLVREAPRAAAAAEETLRAATVRLAPRNETVIAVLDGWLSKATAKRDTATAMEIARRILGLAAQARFHDLEGEKPPEFSAAEARAQEALARCRQEIRTAAGAPLTVEALAAMTREEREAFSAAHATPSRPAFALSAEGRYIVETCAGHATLLGVASTIDHHHKRLANWFGVDPFVKEQGLVRIVPEAYELESEGTPYWWAGGFQSGSVTQMIFHTGTIEGLGHGLTHELTHRFDGSLFAGLPSWMVEGKAVWTGAAYGVAAEENFVEHHISFGTVEQAFIKGYGDKNKLEKLILGTIDDYRDNYTAGYALYVYLKLWAEPADRPLFAPRLNEYMKGYFKGKNRPMEWFARHFIDDKDGRPENFEKFAEGFSTFLRGFYWDSRAPWTERYAVKFRGGKDGYVYDAPTWTRARERAEPFFGQDHLSAAMTLGARLLEHAGVVTLGLRSLSLDEVSDEDIALLHASLMALNQAEAASSLALWRQYRGHAAPAPTQSPWARWPKLQAWLGALASARTELEASGDPSLHAALLGEQDVLARLAAAPRIGAPEPAPDLPPTLEAPAHRLALYGYEEDDLVGYQERRVKNLWYEDPARELHVGRAKPREGTGSLDRHAHQRDAFARSRLWNAPGRYRVKARIHITTSFVSGSVVLGYTRRDRFVRLGFSAGDWLYAIGKKEDKTEIDSVGFHFHGSRVRDHHLAGASPSRTVEFKSPRTSFELELLVDGGMVQAWVEGEFIGTYHTQDGASLEGFLGFAAGQGAYRVEGAAIQREDHRAAHRASPRTSRALRLGEPGPVTFASFRNHRVEGLSPHAEGMLLLVIPDAYLADAQDPKSPDAIMDFLERLKSKLQTKGLDTPTVVYLPSTAVPELRQALMTAGSKLSGAPVEWGEHRLAFAKEESDPFLLFVDPAHVLRYEVETAAWSDSLDKGLEHRLRVSRRPGTGP